MRDPKRIPEILGLLETIWTANPDWRFGQLIENTLDGITFFTEDDLTLQALKNAEVYFK